MNRLSLLLLLPLCINCIGVRNKTKSEQTQVQQTDSIYRVDLQRATQLDQSAAINDIAQDIRFINLEFGKESALSTINFRADKIEDKFIVSSFNTPVMLFDTLGHYEKSIIKFGRARDELRKSIYKSTLSNGQLIFNQGHKVITATPDTVMGYSTEKYYFSIVRLSDGSYVALPNLGSELKDDSCLEFLNSDLEYVESVRNTTPLKELYYTVPQNYSGRLEAYTLSPSKDGGALFKKIFNDTVYLVTGKQIMEPYITLAYGKLMPEVKEITDQNRIHIKAITENNDYIFINFGFHSSVYSIIWDKQKRETIINSKIDYSDNNSLINSSYFTDYITETGESIKVGVAGIDNDTLYCVIRAEDAAKFLDDVSDEDNPILMEVKLR